MSTENTTRDRIAEVAASYRQLSSRAGQPITHSQALDRVIAARKKGENKRNTKG
jgi:uncharacterized phage-associated protein